MTKYFARKISRQFTTTCSDSAHAQTGRDPPCLYACAFILTFMGVSVISEEGNLQQTYSCS